MFQRIVGFGGAAVLAVAVSMTTGCASEPPAPEGQKAASTAATGLKSLRDEIIETKRSTLRCAAALDGLMTGTTPLPERYNKYSAEVKTLHDRATTVRERVQSITANTHEYLELWEQDTAKIGDEELKANAAKRRERVEGALKDIRTKLGTARDAFQPYLKQLDDIDGYLKTDLTAGGIEATTPKMKKAIEDVGTIQAPIDGSIAAIESLSHSLAAVSPPPSK